MKTLSVVLAPLSIIISTSLLLNAVESMSGPTLSGMTPSSESGTVPRINNEKRPKNILSFVYGDRDIVGHPKLDFPAVYLAQGTRDKPSLWRDWRLTKIHGNQLRQKFLYDKPKLSAPTRVNWKWPVY